jgi:pimeloyl-ACP methyl ester carboxylesterase
VGFVTWFWTGLLLLCSAPVAVAGWLTGLYIYLCQKWLYLVVRIFQEKPLFVIPRDPPLDGAEDVSFPTPDGLTLRGCYLRTTAEPRRGVILFGLEFGSNRWSCRSYCEPLREVGYDIFAFETRGQGESDAQPGYDPLQWVTEYEVRDTRAALAYLKSRSDADPRGVGLFGISKGAGAGLEAAAGDPYVRCCVTDGVFACYTTLVPYMRQWFRIYDSRFAVQGLLPSWYYGRVGLKALRKIQKQRRCRFTHLEPLLGRLAPRPLLMIHGGGDTYIKPDMARSLFERARGPKELWIVDGAKHNQALPVAGDEYHRRVRKFFDAHLAGTARETQPDRQRMELVIGS